MSKSQDKENKRNLKEARDYVFGRIADSKISIIPAEEKYVRRSRDDFEAGAKPVVGDSVRMERISLLLSPELLAAASRVADDADTKRTYWLRAAIRKALREGVDVQYELETPIKLEAPNEPEA